jgi:hypothetical protein
LSDQPTPEEVWRDKLLKELGNRQLAIATYERYYDGDHPLPSPPRTMGSGFAEAKRAFRSLSQMGVTNYVKLVADAPADRLRITGFRFGEQAEGDKDAWALWQRNQLDADSGILHHSAITVGNSFVLVWPEKTGPTATVEHASQVIVCYVAGSRRQRAAGLKAWAEDDGTQRVVLYLPDNVYKWQKAGANAPITQWQPPGDDSWPIRNPFNVVPLVEFRCNPSLKPALYGGGRSDFAGVLAIQDRINKTVFDRLVTAEFQAFRQRWAVGWTPDDPNQAMQASMRHLLTFEDAEVKVGEFAQADFTGFIKSLEADVQSMAAITRTPAFYTLGQIANISGDALAALQSGFLARCVGHRDNFTESDEEVMRLLLHAADDPRAADMQSQMIWADIEHVTWAEKADALVKLSALGVPREALWAMIPDVTPQDLERWKIMQADEALFAPEPIVVPTGRITMPAGATANGST